MFVVFATRMSVVYATTMVAYYTRMRVVYTMKMPNYITKMPIYTRMLEFYNVFANGQASRKWS